PLLRGGLVFQAGKSGTAYVISQASPGGIGRQQATMPSYCGGVADGGSAVSGNIVYHPCQDGIVATRVTTNPVKISVFWRTSGTGSSPIVAGGLVWTV